MKLGNVPRLARWGLPAGIVVTIGGVLTATTMSAAVAAPPLPPSAPAHLLAALLSNASPSPLTGTVVETASLGLPALPTIAGTLSLPSLLAGSHTIRVWYSDPAHYRLAIPQNLSESDLIRNGRVAWLWGSSADVVTHIALPAGQQSPPVQSVPLTPQQAADQVLAKVGPTTTIRVDSNVTVAGEAAYQLVLAPKNAGSLIGQVRIAIDGVHHVPLRVQVFAKGASSPALQTGFTSVSFSKPAAANFTFSPPPGATVSQGTMGSGSTGGGTAQGNDITPGLSVVGSGWLAVASLPESSLAELAGTVPSTGSANRSRSASTALGPISSSRSSDAPGAGGSGMDSLGIGTGPVFSAMLNSARQVHGSWGSGRLLQTSLLSMLVTSKGRVLIGAVTPDVLYQAATQPGHAPVTHGQHAAAPATPK